MPRRRSRPRPKNKRVGLSGIVGFLGLAVLCAGLLYFFVQQVRDPGPAPEPPGAVAAGTDAAEPATSPARSPSPPPPAASEASKAPPEAVAEIPPAMPEPPDGSLPPVPPEGFVMPEPRPAPPGTRVAVVIDDLGRSLDDVEVLGDLDVPLSYAVLPFETRTPEVVAELRRRGEEMLLHLPMEAAGDVDPGPGALLTRMNDRQLRRGTRRALEAVPGAAGVNNHMGSRMSADDRSMRAVLSVVSERNLYFLDSRTSVETVGYRLASSMGIPSAERQVFLDRDPDPRLVTYQFRRLLELARSRGSAIAIGHPHPVTLEVLAREMPRAVELGYELVPVSFLLDRPGGLAR